MTMHHIAVTAIYIYIFIYIVSLTVTMKAFIRLYQLLQGVIFCGIRFIVASANNQPQ